MELLSAIYRSKIAVEPQRLMTETREALTMVMQKQSKASKIDEWKNLPIMTADQRYLWWIKKQELIVQLAQTERDFTATESPAQQDALSILSMSAGDEDRLVQSSSRIQSPSTQSSQDPTSSLQPLQERDSTPNLFTGSAHISGPTAQPGPSGGHYRTAESWRKYF